MACFDLNYLAKRVNVWGCVFLKEELSVGLENDCFIVI